MGSDSYFISLSLNWKLRIIWTYKKVRTSFSHDDWFHTCIGIKKSSILVSFCQRRISLLILSLDLLLCHFFVFFSFFVCIISGRHFFRVIVWWALAFCAPSWHLHYLTLRDPALRTHISLLFASLLCGFSYTAWASVVQNILANAKSIQNKVWGLVRFSLDTPHSPQQGMCCDKLLCLHNLL